MAETLYDRIREQNRTGSEASQETVQTTEQTEVQQKENPEASGQGSTEQQTDSATQTREQSTEQKAFDVSGVNEYFKSSFTDENELRTVLESRDKYKDFETQLAAKNKALEEIQQKHNSLLDSLDPEKVGIDKEVLAVSQLKVKYPNADVGIISKLRTSDIDQMNKLDALILIDKLTVKSNVSDGVRRSEILKSLGIDEDTDDLTENDRYRIEREYVAKSGIIDEIRGFQPKLGQYDFVAEQKTRQEQANKDRESLRSRNDVALKTIMSAFTESKSFYKEDGKEHSLVFVVDPKFKEDNYQDILDAYTNVGFDVEKNLDEVRKQIDLEFWLQNRKQIVNDIVKQIRSEERIAAHNDEHSDSPQNKAEAPPTETKVPRTVMESFRTGAFRKK